MTQQMSKFAQDIFLHKYAHTKPDGTKESWEDLAHRVTKHVLKAVGVTMRSELAKAVFEIIRDRKFIPGGRYLYAAGRPFHQVQNCLLLRAEDSREGWSDLLHKASMALMTGAGIGVDYSAIRAEGKVIRRTGGSATGPLALCQMLNEVGRGIMQGGSRRSAIWAGLSWKHPDAHKFIRTKNWQPEVRKLKERDFNFPATLDGTNISVLLDDEFFRAYHDDTHVLHSHAHSVYWETVEQMLKTAEPGFSVDTGINSGETLRNACVSGDTEILTRKGYLRIDSLVDTEVDVWNGFEWSRVTPKITGFNQPMVKVMLNDGRSLRCTRAHKWVLSTDYRGGTSRVAADELKPGDKLIKTEFPVVYEGEAAEDAYTQGFISADGMDNYNLLWVYEPKYMCLGRLNGIQSGKEYTSNTGTKRVCLRLGFEAQPKNFVPFNWDLKSRLNWLAGLFDGDGCELKEGGLQLVSVDIQFLHDVQKLLTTCGVSSKVVPANEAGVRMLPDGTGGFSPYNCQETKRICVGSTQIQSLKTLGLNCERLSFNKSPNRDASRFSVVESVEDAGVEPVVYCFTEPKRNLGCFNGIVTGQCCEVTSRDDSDICNLGSINMARINTLEEMRTVVELATAFLLAGTVYSDVPYAKVDMVRSKNRRLGLGLMGLHEWLLLNGKAYGPDEDLGKYLDVYQTSTTVAHRYAEEWELSAPVKTRAVAPTGTLSIVGETTGGIEPIFCVAYKRRYLKHKTWHYQYVVDPTAKRLIEQLGVNPDNIEDAYVLAETAERRVEFQAWVQKYVDHAISSTLNLPAWGSEANNQGKVREFGNMLMRHLPNLRGVTAYPDGARGGQPLTPVRYANAAKHTGEELVEEVIDVCDLKGGSCGS